MNTQPFSQTGQMIELCCEYLSVWCIWLYVIIVSHTSFRVNLHSIVCLNVKELLAQSQQHIWSLSDSSGIWMHNQIVHKQTPNHLYDAFGYMLLSCYYWIQFMSLKLEIWCLLQARSSLTFRQTIECRFTLKLVCDMVITYS